MPLPGRITLLSTMLFATMAQLAVAAEILVERDVAVPMSDGTVLRANVFRPSEGGPFPVLVTRTPYGKAEKVDESLVRAGFIVVTQDARGRYASQGEYESFVREQTHDGSDGYDTVQWASKLKGSTGKVGLYGTSYPGFLAWRAAGKQPPALAAMAAFSIPASYLDLEGPGTIRPGRRLKWWQGTMSPDLRRRVGGAQPHTSADAARLWNSGEGDKLLHFLPWRDLPDDLFASEAPYVKAWLREPWRDPWHLDRDAAQSLTPNLNVCGWYDHCNGSIDLHSAITEHGGTALVKAQSRLIIGPWSHSGLGRRQQGKIDFGPAAELDLNQLYINWFGHWLRGYNDAVADWPRVRLFVMGVNQWRNFDRWPPPVTSSQSWFLYSYGTPSRKTNHGELVTELAARETSDQYVYNPYDPAPTLWTPSLFTVPADQRENDLRWDILHYQSQPLTKPIETIGYPEVVLYVSSTGPDTDFFARLIDVAPDGRAIDLTAGMVRVRYGSAQATEEVSFLKPGEVRELKIRLRPTAHRFLVGHRIRLDVTSSDFPNYDRHHNTAVDQNSDARIVTARQTVHHGPAHPSRLTLPTQ